MAVTMVDSRMLLWIEYPRCRNWLLEALEHTPQFVEDDVLRGIAMGTQVLWTTENAACVVEITGTGEDRICNLILVGGAKGEALHEVLIEGQQTIIDWAKENGCKGLIGTPRKEWSKLLIRDGFKVDNKNNFYKDF